MWRSNWSRRPDLRLARRFGGRHGRVLNCRTEHELETLRYRGTRDIAGVASNFDMRDVWKRGCHLEDGARAFRDEAPPRHVRSQPITQLCTVGVRIRDSARCVSRKQPELSEHRMS
jgi:hypothetical protein